MSSDPFDNWDSKPKENNFTNDPFDRWTPPAPKKEYNNNPFDTLFYAERSHHVRFKAMGLVSKIGMMTLTLIVITILMNQEWFVHYMIHVPCCALKDPRYIALQNSATNRCSRCLEMKQRAINLLTPEQREIVRQRDEFNIRAAREAAQSNIEYQKWIKEEQQKESDRRFDRDLRDF